MRCNRCRMEIRRTEMEIHLSHAHDIGPMSGKKERKDKGGRAPRRNSD